MWFWGTQKFNWSLLLHAFCSYIYTVYTNRKMTLVLIIDACIHCRAAELTRLQPDKTWTTDRRRPNHCRPKIHILYLFCIRFEKMTKDDIADHTGTKRCVRDKKAPGKAVSIDGSLFNKCGPLKITRHLVQLEAIGNVIANSEHKIKSAIRRVNAWCVAWTN